MVDFENKLFYDIYDLRKLIHVLRGPGGCPWDREQTHESIRRNLLEEAYEAAAAIDTRDTDNLVEELGDILMQVMFHADIAEDAGVFDLDAIADVTCKKLIRRHPHVFGGFEASDGEQSLVIWDEIKRKEKQQDSTADAMRSVARSLPSLCRAEKLQKKAAKVGFDWPEYTGALDALHSELRELEDAISSGGDVGGELGDLLFSAVNISRFFSVDPEEALERSCEKFIRRFKYVEDTAREMGRELASMTLGEMDAIYNRAKEEERELEK